MLAPSSWHGVTTIMFGNCGVGFAPVRREHRQALIDLMEGVEDIPGFALTEGINWEWESFPEFLDTLDRMPRAVDIAAQVPHHPLRVYVMGDRAIRHEPATADDVAAMRDLTEQALRAGAFGFTTSRTDAHKTTQGDLVPGRFARVDELLGIGQALGNAKVGAFGMLSDFEDEAAEFRWITKQAKDTGQPVWFLLTDRPGDPERFRRLLAGVHAARAQGAPVAAQVAGRPVGVILGVATSFNPFSIRPSWRPLDALTVPERMKRLQNPALRDALLNEKPTPEIVARMNIFHQTVTSRWDRMYVMGNPPDYEPPPKRSVAAIAARGNRTPDEVALDYLTESAENFLFFPVTGYVHGDLGAVREMLVDPATILGLSDGRRGIAARSWTPACRPTC